MYTALAAASLLALAALPAALPQPSTHHDSSSAAAQAAATEGWPLVTGAHWKESSRQQKRAYLLGLANTLTIEEALDTKHGQRDPNSESARMNAALAGNSLDSCIASIDRWYDANPSRINLPIIGAAWLAIVKGAQQ